MCVRARTRRFLGSLYLCRLFALFVILALLFLSVALSYLDFHKHFDLQHSMCSMLLFFFLTKGIPSHLAIDSLTHSHTPKIRLRKTILEFLLHTTYLLPSLSPSFGQFFSHLSLFFFFWLCFYPFFSLHDFLTTRKRKFALSISSLQFQGLQLPPTDTCYHGSYALNLLSVTTQLSAHSYIS